MNKRLNIGFLIDDLDNYFSAQACKGAELAAKALDANLFIFPGHYLGTTDSKYQGVEFEYQYNTVFGLESIKSADILYVLMGTIALFTALQLRQVIRGQREDLSTACYVWNLAGTVGVTLTMLVTVFFLEPTMAPQFGLFALFAGSNFLLHLFNPLLAIVTFTVFEKTRKIPFRHTLTGIVPMVLYAVFYLANCMRHAVNGMVDIAYDWYGFLAGGVKTVWIVIPVIFLFTWLISIALWRLNRRKTEL